MWLTPSEGRAELAHPDGGGLQVLGLPEHGELEGAPGSVAGRHGDDWLQHWPPGPSGDWSGLPPEAQPGFPGVVDGPAARMERLHALGNGVLPQVVAAAWNLLTKE